MAGIGQQGCRMRVALPEDATPYFGANKIFRRCIMKNRFKIFPRFLFFVVFFSLSVTSFLIFSPHKALSAEVSFGWDSNIESNVAGYKLYYGFESGNYSRTINVGNQTSYSIQDLEPNLVYYFTLTAYDSSGNESDSCEEISYLVPEENLPPVADAGPDQTVLEGVSVTLDGMSSTDPNGDSISYLWEQTGGPGVVLSNTVDGGPTFTAPDVGPGGASLSFRLTVSDSTGLESEDTCIVKVSWVNVPPTANASFDQTVDERDTVTLNGAGSSDPDDGIASFYWKQTGGPSVKISDPTASRPVFTAPDVSAQDEFLTFQLTVEDFGGLSSTDTCAVNVSRARPTADAGPDQIVDEGIAVTLDGTNSTDPNGDAVSYLWEQTDGPAVALLNTAEGKATFTAPDVGPDGASLSFRLTAFDSTGLESEDTCIVNVSWVNIPPTVNASPDQTVDEGDTVTLNGAQSSDPDDGIASYLWEQTGGPSVYLSDPADPQPTFVAPDVSTQDVSLTFQLTVEDFGGLRSTDSCVVNVSWTNVAPLADAGSDQTAKKGSTVTLDGSNSSDPDDGIASVRWKQLTGTPVTFSDPAAMETSFILPDGSAEGQSLEFQLTVTDTGGLASQDSCTVIVGAGSVYENAEDGDTAGWAIYDNNPAGAVISNVFDDERQSRVIQLNGSGTGNGYRLRNRDGSPWHNTEEFTIEWSMKYTESFMVYVDVETTDGHRYIVFTSSDSDKLGDVGSVYYGLGSSAKDGEWHTFSRDLEADLENAQPGVRIIEVNGFLIRGSGRVDDVKLRNPEPSGTKYEDGEDGGIARWGIYDNTPAGAVISNVFDDERQSRVIQLNGSGTGNGYRLRNQDGSPWHNTEEFTIEWSMKYTEKFMVYVDVETTAGHRYIVFTPSDRDKLRDVGAVYYGLGSSAMDGEWHTFTADLDFAIENAQPGVQVTEVNGFLIRGSGRVDDIQLKAE